MRRTAILTVLLAPCCLVAAGPAQTPSRIIYVDDDANGLNNGSSWINAYQYLQDALADANTAEKPVEIRVAQGTYKPDQGRGKTPGDRQATFQLVDGTVLEGGFAGVKTPDPNVRDIQRYETVLSGDLLGNDTSDYLTHDDDSLCLVRGDFVGGTTRIEGFTLTGGGRNTTGNYYSCGILLNDSNPLVFKCQFAPRPQYGAAGLSIACTRSSPSVTDCNFAGAWSMGVSALDHSGPIVTNCAFKSNGSYSIEVQSASDPNFVNCVFTGTGACLRATDSNVAMANCRIAHSLGGRMYCYTSNLTMTGCDIVKNPAGGIDGDGELKLSRCSFVGNRGFTNSLIHWYGNVTADDCTFTGNTALMQGIVWVTGDLTASRCQFIGNLPQDGPGAIEIRDHKLTAKNCLFTGNIAKGDAGAIYAFDTLLAISNCTFADNRGEPNTMEFFPPDTSSWDSRMTQCIIRDGPTPFQKYSWDMPGRVGLTITYTDIQGGYPGKGNFDVDPCFVSPGHYEPDPNQHLPGPGYPGPGLAWVQGDYHLKSQAGHWDQKTATWICDQVTSPCVDAGDPCSPVGEEPVPNGGRIDVGAYGGTVEASKSSSTGGNGLNTIPCWKLPSADRPALAYVLLDNMLSGHLYVASFHEGTIQRQEISWGGLLTVTQLDNAVFLVDTPSMTNSHMVTVVDLAKGRGMPLAENADIRCLRCEPKRGKAMLMQVDTRTQEKRLFELDLKTLQITLCHTFTKAALGEKFDLIQAPISPDFTRVIEAKANPAGALAITYTLRAVDLATMEARDFANGVSVWLPPSSYYALRAPPAEWISDAEVVYQSMPLEPGESTVNTEGRHVLYRANVDTGETTEIFRGMFWPLLETGSLWVNPLNGELIYRNEWTVDLAAGTLTPKDYPFSVTSSNLSMQVKIQCGQTILYDGSGVIGSTCISPSHRNFAYAINDRLYVATDSGDKPQEVARSSSWVLEPAGWIE